METQPVSFFFTEWENVSLRWWCHCGGERWVSRSNDCVPDESESASGVWGVGRVWQEGQHAATGSAGFSALTSSPPSQIFTSHFFPEQTDAGGLAPPPPAPPSLHTPTPSLGSCSIPPAGFGCSGGSSGWTPASSAFFSLLSRSAFPFLLFHLEQISSFYQRGLTATRKIIQEGDFFLFFFEFPFRVHVEIWWIKSR